MAPWVFIGRKFEDIRVAINMGRTALIKSNIHDAGLRRDLASHCRIPLWSACFLTPTPGTDQSEPVTGPAAKFFRQKLCFDQIFIQKI